VRRVIRSAQFQIFIDEQSLSDARENVRQLGGDALVNKLKPVWGLDEEGELNSVYRDSGQPGLWFMMGNLFNTDPLCAANLALQETWRSAVFIPSI